MKYTTAFFDSVGNHVRTEKGMTLQEYFDFNREFKPGTLLCLQNDDGTKYEDFYVGDCTPQHQPSKNDGSFGWDGSDERLTKIVSEVYLPHFPSNPKF